VLALHVHLADGGVALSAETIAAVELWCTPNM
jgi:hypothetical protein